MTLTINDTTMTSHQSAHTARHSPERNGGEVSWLLGQVLDRNAAITAMVLADMAGPCDVRAGTRLWTRIKGWAAPLGLTTADALAQTVSPPDRTDARKDELHADPEAAG